MLISPHTNLRIQNEFDFPFIDDCFLFHGFSLELFKLTSKLSEKESYNLYWSPKGKKMKGKLRHDAMPNTITTVHELKVKYKKLAPKIKLKSHYLWELCRVQLRPFLTIRRCGGDKLHGDRVGGLLIPPLTTYHKNPFSSQKKCSLTMNPNSRCRP